MALNTTVYYGIGPNSFNDFNSNNSKVNELINKIKKSTYFGQSATTIKEIKNDQGEVVDSTTEAYVKKEFTINDFLKNQNLSFSLLENGKKEAKKYDIGNDLSKDDNADKKDNITAYVKDVTSNPTGAGNEDQVESVKKDIMKAASDQMIQNFFDIYMSPDGDFTDINLRLGKPVKTLVYDSKSINDIVNSDIILKKYATPVGARIGIYTPSNFITNITTNYINNPGYSYNYSKNPSTEKYVGSVISNFDKKLNDFGKKGLPESNDYFCNYQFPPFTQMTNISESYQDLAKSYIKSRTNTYNLDDLVVTRENFPYREVAFKQINDNIHYLQWVTERLTGIVSTYLTDWDISLYIQEGLVTNSDGLKPKYISMLHRIQQDAPATKRDPLHTYPFGVVGAAVSKLYGGNKLSWIPNYHPYSRYWASYPEWRNNARFRTKTFYDSKIKIPKYYEIAYRERAIDGATKGNVTSLRKQLQYDDYQGAALSGYTNWNMKYYQALYSTPGDELSDVDTNQMSKSDSFSRNSTMVDENLENLFGTSYASGDSGKVGSSDSSSETEYDDYENLDELEEFGDEDDDDDEGLNLGDMLKMGKESKETNMELATGGTGGTYNASNVSSQSAGLLGTDKESFDNAKTVGIPQRNPVLFGGPHSSYSSPLSIKAYYEPDNPFFRDIPRINADDINTDKWVRWYNRDYDLNPDYLKAKETCPYLYGYLTEIKVESTNTGSSEDYTFRNAKKYTIKRTADFVNAFWKEPQFDFCQLEKFSSMSYTFSDDRDVIGPKAYEHSFKELKNAMKEGAVIFDNGFTAQESKALRMDVFPIGWGILKVKTWERDRNDPGMIPDIYALARRAVWNNWWRGWRSVQEEFNRLCAANIRYRYEAVDKYVLFTEDRNGNYQMFSNILGAGLPGILGNRAFTFLKKDKQNNISDIYGLKVKPLTLPIVSQPDDYGRRSKFGDYVVYEVDLENPVFQFSGLEKSEFNPNVKGDDFLKYRLNGNDRALDINCAVYPGKRKSEKLKTTTYFGGAFSGDWFQGYSLVWEKTTEGITGDFVLDYIRLSEKFQPKTKLKYLSFVTEREYNSNPVNLDVNTALKKAFYYPTFYSSTQAPNSNKQMLTNENRYYRYDPIISMRLFYNLLLKQKAYLEDFNKNFLNSKNYDFKTFKNIITNCKAGNPVISNRVIWLTDNDEKIQDPNDPSRMIDKSKIFGYNRWIAYARDLFEKNPIATKAALAMESSEKSVKVISAIADLAFIKEATSIKDLSIEQINKFQSYVSSLYPVFNQVKDTTGSRYTEDMTTKFLLSYLNILYEIRKYFINKRCNKQEGPLFMMRSLESTFPMIVAGSNADSQEPDITTIGDDTYSSAKTNVAFYSVKEKIEDKVEKEIKDYQNDVKTEIKEDHIEYVYIKVKYATKEEYAAEVEEFKRIAQDPTREENPILRIIKMKVKDKIKYVKVPLNGKYRLESKELLMNEGNIIYNGTLDPKSDDYFLKAKPIYNIDIAYWNNLIWNDAEKCDKKEFLSIYQLTHSSLPKFPSYRDVHIETDIVVELNPERLMEAVKSGITDPQNLLCAGQAPTDYWKIRVVDKLPGASGYQTDVKLKMWDGSESSQVLTYNLLGGVNAACISPIVKEQANNGLLMQDTMLKAQEMSTDFRNSYNSSNTNKDLKVF